jgi:hypothetical protein
MATAQELLSLLNASAGRMFISRGGECWHMATK